ncbi:hypothetical protein EMIHUDRAFT_239951 [Emiliania huxleyi CCMP1516]|uniref:Photosynthesis system II assembly factor Ycf48/Hcf136-like domain-containing protein n=2 Tax=Emiliania huxleyi TaxID=2903 RepID=A0A0D3JIA7_EMIH1|nr:hypothetical protein EMIHUDRAFT_239951 [Emiliania huxleyi CCMP1516]EOD23242.1 hypothetical protein EMIHUDRAFT_239951 [Emiliania huxleyi CCMP1516]|eukprot:XP_005775671.1 hypothetical protein EMIHUDRAFT_239951 [Emiliania huxleyi CCMP1516]
MGGAHGFTTIRLVLLSLYCMPGEAAVPERGALFSSVTPRLSPPPPPDWTGKLGFAVGTAPKIMKTADGGETWTALAEGNVASCGDIKVSDSGEVVWAVCNDEAGAVALKSLDSGVTFAKQRLPPSCGTMLGISVIDADAAFAAGDSGCLLKTDNGGSNWTELAYWSESRGIPKIPFQSINAISRDSIFASGSPTPSPKCSAPDWACAYMLRSTDGGKTWTTIIASNAPKDIDKAPAHMLDVSPHMLDCGRVAVAAAGGHGLSMYSRDAASKDGEWNVVDYGPPVDNNAIVMVKADTAYMAYDNGVRKVKLFDDGRVDIRELKVPGSTQNFAMGITAIPNAYGEEPQLWLAKRSAVLGTIDPGCLLHSPDGGKTWAFKLNGTQPEDGWRRISFVGDLRRPGVAFSC